ncbi:ABC multidrug transporter Mdr2 [Talaromyces proteolyticus]|uniref:ABC multidrug transporter MDR2 n=1 Tax=Talaromyces proteolyticus TaxID=1131652 RepID=A0AAD4L201_9EURO|nr:ABC multidrug transporter Mdr2 [Talaromyces proteolyticus]KAH8704161.1 ABC multidrug transporter Mdr2 [Talaromyces proteolyticus]
MRSSKLLAALDPRAGTGLVRTICAQSSRTAHPCTGQPLLTTWSPSRFSSTSSTLGLNAFRSDLAPRLSFSPKQQLQTRSTIASQLRYFSVSRKLSDSQQRATDPVKVKVQDTDSQGRDEDAEQGFQLSEKGAQAAQINLSAKLGRDAKENGNKPGFSEVWRLLKIARPEAKHLGLAFFFLLISSGITMSIPFSIGKIMDIVTKGETANDLFGLTMPMFFGTLAGIMCIGAAANYGRIIILRIVGERVVARQRSKLFRRTFIQDAEFFDANRVGDLISRLSSDTLIVGKAITQNLSDGLRAVVSGTAGFAAMTYVSVQLSSVLALLFPVIGLSAFFYGRAIRNLSRKIQKNLGTLTKIAEERLGNVKTSQAFAAEMSEVHRYNNQVKTIFELGKRESFISATFFSSTGLMGNMTILILLYVGGGLVQSGGITVGELTSFLMYAAYAGSSLFGMSSFYSELMKGVGAASRLFELQDRQPNISPTIGEKIETARGPIRFENVSFSYPTRPAVTIFKDLDFEIPQGSNVAIVGPSGGGKSTITSLLLRFYNPNNGRVLINGKDIAKMNAKSLRRKIGIVSQEPVLFSGTIAENIAYGVPDAPRSEIIAAARKANCQFISDFPSGLDTHVGPRGAQLSGGQKQRIAIARALIKNPDILILDEATSALDAESETLVNSALASLLRGNNTTISIAHRLSTIKRSDTIIVLGNDGRVAEIGSYQDLSSRPDGAFTKLMEWQMTGGETVPQAPFKKPPSFEEQMEELERTEREGDTEAGQDDHGSGPKVGVI